MSRQYKFVKDQFEVVPQKDLLIKQGFVPAPKGHELELVDLTTLESTPRAVDGNSSSSGPVTDSKAAAAASSASKDTRSHTKAATEKVKDHDDQDHGRNGHSGTAAEVKKPIKPKPRRNSNNKVHVAENSDQDD